MIRLLICGDSLIGLVELYLTFETLWGGVNAWKDHFVSFDCISNVKTVSKKLNILLMIGISISYLVLQWAGAPNYDMVILYNVQKSLYKAFDPTLVAFLESQRP